MKNKFNPVVVTVKGDNVQDERLFTSTRKLSSYLRFLRKNYPENLKVKYKAYKPN